MKRFTSFVLIIALLVTMLVGCGQKPAEPAAKPADTPAPADKPADPPAEKPKEVVTFRMAEVHPEGYPTTMADREFARLVEERTDGRIKIEVYSGGQLGDEKSVTEQVQFGAIDFARLSLSPITEFEKSLNVLMLPYIYRDKEHMFQVVDGPIGDKLLVELEKSGLIGLSWFDAGARNFYNSKREIKSPDDMKGLKIRVQETKLMMDLVSSLGSSPVAMAFGDVYSALQTGVIDGAENNWSSYDTTHHYEVAKYFTVDEHTRVPELILTSKMVIDKLSTEDQEIIKKAAREAAEYERIEWEKAEEVSKQKVIDAGCTITYVESNAAFQEKVMKLYEEFGKGYEDLIQEIINTK